MLLPRLQKQLKQQNWLAVILEVFIVILGVTLAFQINVWNGNKTDRKVTVSLLKGILSDLEADEARIATLTSFYLEKDEHLQTLLKPGEEQSNEALGAAFNGLLEFKKFVKVGISYQALIEGQYLGKIRGEEAREAIVSYYSIRYLEWSTEIYGNLVSGNSVGRFENFIADDRLTKVASWVDNLKYQTDYDALRRQNEVRHFLIDLLGELNYVKNNLASTKVRVHELKQLLETEIDQR